MIKFVSKSRSCLTLAETAFPKRRKMGIFTSIAYLITLKYAYYGETEPDPGIRSVQGKKGKARQMNACTLIADDGRKILKAYQGQADLIFTSPLE